MHFHLPKPLHGWREFAGEVGIIVLGVLIALGAQQLVESAHLKLETDALRTSMRDELADDRGRWEVMHVQQACMVNWLSQLSAWSNSAPVGAKWPLNADSPNFFNAHVSTWEMARSSAAVAAMSLDERDQLADIYQVLGYAQVHIQQVYVDWNNAYLLAEAGGAQNRAALPLAILRAHRGVDQLMDDYATLTPRFAALGIRPNYRALRLAGVSVSRCAPTQSRS